MFFILHLINNLISEFYTSKNQNRFASKFE